MTTLTKELAEKFAALGLSHVGREFPNKLDHVMGDADDVRTPRSLHPIFFGSFDWHSCVHGHWLLARLLHRYADLRAADAIVEHFSHRVTAENVEVELAYLSRPESRGFERPYGWGWLLALQSELECARDATLRRAADTLRPLAEAFAARFKTFLPLCDYPVRSGMHASTAFALRTGADYAERLDPELFELMQAKALSWFGDDCDAQAWEPSQEDFLSPTLMQAECMRRFLPTPAFSRWFEQFLPRAASELPAPLFVPARVSDRSDGRIAHLDGLNFSRAWCWRAIASALPANSEAATQARLAAERHIAASLPYIAGEYMGEHWLATFALLALDA